jgi:hypothetical protein
MLQAGKVVASIPDEVIRFFNLPNISNRTVTLGSTQPLTEMTTREVSGGKGRPAHKADNLTAICEPIVKKMWEPRRLTALWATTACYRDSFTFIIIIIIIIIMYFIFSPVNANFNFFNCY